MNLKVGQKVWVKRTGRWANSGLTEGIITDIKKKYFIVDGKDKYVIETMNNNYSDNANSWANYPTFVFTTQDGYNRMLERNELFDTIRPSFEWSKRDNFTLDQLRRIDNILKESK